MAFVDKYSSGSKFFHWLIALIVIILLSMGFFLGDFPQRFMETAYTFHKSFGICVFFLMFFRLFWLKYTGRPLLPETMPAWEKNLSRTVQYSLYVFLILMPLSGWIMSTASEYQPYFFGLFHIPFPGVSLDKPLMEQMQQVHYAFAWIIIALVILHIAGALKHHFYNKDDVLRKIWLEKKTDISP